MKIDELINSNYPSISVLEDMRQVVKWLNDADYYVVIDEEIAQ